MMLTVVRNANMGLSFLLELCMLAAFAVWGIYTGQSVLMKVLLGVGLPLLAAIFWGVFLSPRANVELPYQVVQILKFVIFGLAAAALGLSQHPGLGWALGAAFVLNRVLEYV